MLQIFTRRRAGMCLAVAICATTAARAAFAINNLTVNSGNTNLSLNQIFNSITINGGSVTITAGAVKTNTLTLGGSSNAWTGTLDLDGNKLVVEAATNKPAVMTTLLNQIIFGQTHSTGILSTGLPANMGVALLDNALLGKNTFGPQSADANSLLLSPELLGDTNASGTVDLTDLSTVLNNFGTATSAWTSGNFDNAPTIDLTDLSDVLNNFGATNGNASLALAPMFLAAPEPASLALLAAGTLMLISRRRNSI